MIFLDTNVLLELILTGRPWFQQVERFLETVNEETAVSMFAAHLVMHFGRKEQGEDAFLHAVLHENKLLSLLPEDYQWAVNNEQGRDFEDALQMAVAIRSECSSFVTLDTALAKRYSQLPIDIIVP